jgi:hypothetical protein
MFPGYKLTLTGDLVDSFVWSRTEQLLLLEEVLNDIEASITECIIGNHEWSYLWPERMKCSGHDAAFAVQLLPLHARMFKLMKPYIYDDSYAEPILFTHAGLSAKLLEDFLVNDQSLLTTTLENELRALDEGMAFNIGASRGGPDPVGGIFWCDYNHDFEPIEGLRQVFGHTALTEVGQDFPRNYNIDCSQYGDPQALKIEDDGTIEIINITPREN